MEDNQQNESTRKKVKHFDGTQWILLTEDEFNELMRAKYEDEVDQHAVVQERIEIGRKIMLEYLVDNSKLNLTAEQNVQQLQKFQAVKAFLEVGNFKNSKVMIEAAVVDDVFTQERKEKYLAMFPIETPNP